MGHATPIRIVYLDSDTDMVLYVETLIGFNRRASVWVKVGLVWT
jgi:hypothetical protein